MLPAETNTFDDKFLRFNVKKAVDQGLSSLGQFLIKVSRFATTPNVQSEVSTPPPYAPKLCSVMQSVFTVTPDNRRKVKRTPLNIGNDNREVPALLHAHPPACSHLHSSGDRFLHGHLFSCI